MLVAAPAALWCAWGYVLLAGGSLSQATEAPPYGYGCVACAAAGLGGVALLVRGRRAGGDGLI
jgi:hypothetical protein